jgi:hypothetical protein
VKLKWILALVFAVGGVAVTAGVVLATPQSGFIPAQQWKGVFDEMDVHVVDMPGHQVKLKTKGVSDVYVTRNAIAVGGQSGWHTHPGPSLIIVTVGEIMAYDGDDPTCTPQALPVRRGFRRPGRRPRPPAAERDRRSRGDGCGSVPAEGRDEADRRPSSGQLSVLRRRFSVRVHSH